MSLRIVNSPSIPHAPTKKLVEPVVVIFQLLVTEVCVFAAPLQIYVDVFGTNVVGKVYNANEPPTPAVCAPRIVALTLQVPAFERVKFTAAEF